MKNPLYLLVLQVLVIPIVILVFKLPAERKVLSLLANGIFWFIGIVTVFYRGPYNRWAKFGGVQFLFLAVIPITILRYLSWNTDFNQESLLGLSGAQWHGLSNSVFLLMIGLTLVVLIKNKLNVRKSK